MIFVIYHVKNTQAGETYFEVAFNIFNCHRRPLWTHLFAVLSAQKHTQKNSLNRTHKQMFSCALCSFSTGVLQHYVSHYRGHHHIHNFRFPCGIIGCLNTFATSTYIAFHTHVYQEHAISTKQASSYRSQFLEVGISLKCKVAFVKLRLSLFVCVVFNGTSGTVKSALHTRSRPVNGNL